MSSQIFVQLSSSEAARLEIEGRTETSITVRFNYRVSLIQKANSRPLENSDCGTSRLPLTSGSMDVLPGLNFSELTHLHSNWHISMHPRSNCSSPYFFIYGLCVGLGGTAELWTSGSQRVMKNQPFCNQPGSFCSRYPNMCDRTKRMGNTNVPRLGIFSHTFIC
jgi:hypothetical protein